MAKIDVGILKDFMDGEYIDAADLDQIFELLRVAINDNYDKVVARYTKTEVDTLLANIGAGVANSINVVTELPTNTIQGKFVLKSPENIVYYDTGTVWKEFTTATALAAAVETLVSADSTMTTNLNNHTARTDNPHSVTAAQISALHTSQKGDVNGVASYAQLRDAVMYSNTLFGQIYAITKTYATSSDINQATWGTVLSTTLTKSKGEKSLHIQMNDQRFTLANATSYAGWDGRRVWVNGVLIADELSDLLLSDYWIDIDAIPIGSYAFKIDAYNNIGQTARPTGIITCSANERMFVRI